MTSSSAPAGDSTSTIAAEMVSGSHVVTISGYSGTKGIGVGKGISSATFAIGGHDWHLRYFPDGFKEQNADFISFFLRMGHPGADANDEAVVHDQLLLEDNSIMGT
ncbi:hypothetical protein BAE44_0010008 [Dichanthelium oligosanthes]|uniref:MATH domain-containing protein n=1 Tax=Dichanthelium oligosanthes TaxID=888268 RepID=A0A1E5VV62_9POAL|nr:hypothetical protein BAE44_0010008 [Dichanthelium oligosanthes]